MELDIVDTEKKINYFALLAYFVSLSLFVVMRICGVCGVFNNWGPYASYFLSLITQVGIIFLVPLTIFTLVTKSKVKHVSVFCMFKKASYKVILISFVLGIVVFFLNNYVSTFFNTIIQFFGYKPSTSSDSALPATWWTFLLNLLCTAVLPAFAEEVLHRGLLLNGVSMMGIKKSVLISGVLFGLFHLNIEQCFYAIIIGIFLGFLCHVCWSIYPCMIVHFMNNALSVFLSFARQKGWAIGNIFTYVSAALSKNVFLGIVVYLLFFILLLILLSKIMGFIMKETVKYGLMKHTQEFKNKIARESFYQEIDAIKNDNFQPVQQYRTITVDFKDLFNFIKENKEEIVADEKKSIDEFKPDFRAKILLWGCFALSIVITVMTFIWGLFR